MKPIMYSLFSMMLFAFSADVSAQSDDFLLIRIYEDPNSSSFSKIIVSQNGKIKEIEELNSIAIKNFEDNQLIIHSVFQRYNDSGYKITCSNSANTGNSVISTYILKKE